MSGAVRESLAGAANEGAAAPDKIDITFKYPGEKTTRKIMKAIETIGKEIAAARL